jgi:putative heme-binding domain-containing protein
MSMRVLATALLLAILTRSAFAAPHWVWLSGRKATDSLTLKYAFDAPVGLKSARLRLVADYATARLSINGKAAGVAEPYGPVVKLDAVGLLRPGRNELRLVCNAGADAPAVALELAMVDGEGKGLLVSTSGAWKTGAGGAGLVSYGDLGQEKWWGLPPLLIDEADDYTQWKRASNAKAGTDPATFRTKPGYAVELLRTAGKDEGSWVSLAFDSAGRLTIAREDKGLIRYILSGDRETVTGHEMINSDLRECRGLLYAHDSLYVNANNSRGLYRLRDTNGDGRLDEKKLLHSSPGSVGHGRNALALGPDGRIYAIHGDAVNLPDGIADRTSPLRRNAPPFRPNEGHVLRMDPDGSNREIFCAGMRNPYGIDFNADGEAFTYDADAEFDMGTPWYRPTRVNHLSSGADFGWRAVTGSWPAYYPDHPDNTQAALDIGKGSPTGVRFGTGSRFPPDYQEALYILDWAYGRILAVHLVSRGSTYMGKAEVFLRGEPLNLTDLVFGPDGAMYFVTGGRKTRSALYRVSYTGPAIEARARTEQEQAREKLSRAGRLRRRAVEAHHGEGKGFAGVLRGPLDDPRVAQAARIAFEHNSRNPEAAARLRKRNLSSANVELLTAAANIAAPAELPALLEKWLDAHRGWNDWPPSQQAGFIDIYRRALGRHKLPVSTRNLIRDTLGAHFPSDSTRINNALAAILIELDPTAVVPKAARLLEASAGRGEIINYLYRLRGARSGWEPASRRVYFGRLELSRTFPGGRGLPQILKNIRRDALATLDEGEKKELEEILGRRPALSPLPGEPGRRLVKEWKTDDFKEGLGFDAAGRDIANGRKVFTVALCDRCHRYGGEGYAVGPELTRASARFARRDLLREILEPSSTVAENYQTSILELKDGRVLTGQVIPNLDYRAPELQLAPDPLHPDKITRIPKVKIVRRRVSAVSLMPTGLLNTFSREEILDLLAWLERGWSGGGGD